MFEDHDALVREGEAKREQMLDELRDLGVDTLRVGIKWNEVAPRPLSRTRPRFDATNPDDYPGFGNYDDLLRRAADKGFRVVAYLAPDAPRWATAGRARVSAATVNTAARPPGVRRLRGGGRAPLLRQGRDGSRSGTSRTTCSS